MKKLLIIIALLLLAIVPQASAGTVTFDDAYGNSIVGVQWNFGQSFSDMGLTFTNNGSYMYVWGPTGPNNNGTNSLIFAGFDAADFLTITKTGGGTFDLYSLDMTISFYNTNASENIFVNGNPITLVQGIQNYTLNLLGVTQVVITSLPGMGYWLADNINTNVAAPLPGTLLLLGSGLLGIAGLRMSRKS